MALVFVCEAMFRDSLRAATHEDTPDLQSISSLKSFFTVISALGSHYAFYLFYICIVVLASKPAALYLICAIFTANFVSNQLKSSYGDLRPYWNDKQIVGMQCQTGYSNPSGHLLQNCFFWTTIYLHLYFEVGVHRPRITVFCTAYIIQLCAVAHGITYLILMGFSRVYLGVHTYNEVLFGAALGTVLAIIGHYQIKPFFLSLPERLYSNQQGSKYRVHLKDYFGICLATFVIPLFLANLVFLSREILGSNTFITSAEFKRRLVDSGCPIVMTRLYNIGHFKHFSNSGAIVSVAGSICGQLFEWQFLVNAGKLNTSLWSWQSTSPFKTFLRFLVASILISVCASPYLFGQYLVNKFGSD